MSNAQTGTAEPLAGLTVVDFSRVLAGPFATALLADLGADVIKIEPPTGDDYRQIGPFIQDQSALFAFANRGKRSIVLDLKNPQDLDIALQLVDHADVVVENFRPGVASKLGIGADALMARNKRLIYASISGFGQSGPLADRPAYDIIVQALTGLMSITGDPEGPPTMVGEALGDLSAGLFASWAILAALYQRERTNSGCRIDLAMFDSLLAMMPTATCRYLTSGEVPTRTGNRHPLSAPFGAYRTADGYVIVTILNTKLFEQFAALIGRLDLLSDPRFESDAERSRNEPILREAFETWSCKHSTDEVVKTFSAAGIPAAPIESVSDAVDSAHVQYRQLFRTSQISGQIAQLPEQPVWFSTTKRGKAVSVPDLDEHGSLIRGRLSEGIAP
jgi:CoA:oxalate CoA-transferase